MIKLDYSHVDLKENIFDYQEKVNQLHQSIVDKTCKGNDYLGWYDWPVNYDKEELDRIVEVAKEIRENADVLLVCGIGGSYLGARSAIEMLKGLYPDDSLEIIYTGNTVSSSHLYQTLKHIEGKSVYLNVISKSGTTTETAIAFRLFKNYLEDTYGKQECKKELLPQLIKQEEH